MGSHSESSLPRFRKWHALAALAGLASALVAACAAWGVAPAVQEAEDAGTLAAPSCVLAIHGDTASLDPQGQVVSFWHPFRGDAEALLLELVDEFNRTNPSRIIVLAESLGSAAEIDGRIDDGVGSGRVPDLSTLQPGQVATYASKGALAPIECYAVDPRWGYSQTEREDFFGFALDAGFIPQLGVRYGWPFHATAEVLYYNKDWLSELGFDGTPETWEQFAEMACAAAQQPFSNYRGEGAAAGYAFEIDSRNFTALVLSRGGAISVDGNSAYAFGGPEGLDTLLFLKEVADRGCATQALVRGDERVEFGAGRALFNIAPLNLLPWYQNAVEEGAGFDWAITLPPHPANLGPTPIQVYGPGFAVFRSSPEKQLAAWLFARWFNEPEQQARWVAGTSHYPTRRSATDLLADFRSANPQYDSALALAAAAYVVEPAVTQYDQCRAAMEQMMIAVFAGGDASAALAAASDRCDALLQAAQ